MQSKIKTLILVSVCTLMTNFSFSQNETCTHVINKSNPSEMISYLFSKYNVEESEQILLKVQSYEVLNDVRILCKKEYSLLIDQLDFEIENKFDSELQTFLKIEKRKIILFNTIENQL